MYPLTFAPFVGAFYHNQNLRILTLGESHYFGEEDMQLFQKDKKHINITGITQKVVQNFLDYKNGKGEFHRWMNTFTKYANALENKELNAQECIAVWEKIAFYNFVQTPMPHPRFSPTQEDFKKSRKAFESVLKELKPHFIIFWGHRLWNHFEKDNYSVKNGIHYLNYQGIDYPFLVVPHPSSSAMNKSFYPEIKKFISKL